MNPKKLPKVLSIVIPAYNEEHYIEKTLTEVLNADTKGLKKEIIVVDDGSSDATAQVVERMKRNIPELALYGFTKNRGKSAAVKYGLKKTTGDIVLIQDADLEYSPVDFPVLLTPFFDDDADVVYGSRFMSQTSRRVLYVWHSLANRFLTFLSNILTNLNFTDIETGYKVFRGDIIRSLAPKLVASGFGFEVEITARISKIKELKIYEVGISYRGRTYAEGKKIGLKDGLQALFDIIWFNLLI